MTPQILGVLAGAAFGYANYAILRTLAGRIENNRSNPQSHGSARVLRMVAMADLIVFPILGYFLGPIVLA